MWKIEKPELLAVRDNTESAILYKTNFGDLWFSTPISNSVVLSQNMSSALIGLLIPAMKKKIDLHLAGVVDELLFYYASGPLQSALVNFNPSLQRINISCDSTSQGYNFGKEVVSGLSRGVDSFSVIDRHFIRNVKSILKGTLICLHDVWSDKNEIDVPNLAVIKRFNNLKPLLEGIKYPAYLVNSNLGSFYKDFSFVATHTLRNIAAAHAVASVGTYIYASAGYPLSFQSLSIHPEIARTDLLLMPMLSSTELRCISGDAEKTRLEKIVGIADLGVAHEFLQVCSHSVEVNCSSCDKCLRTMVAIDILDKISEFSKAFNFKLYSSKKFDFINENQNDPYIVELIDYAKAHDISIF
jgi:hypothetical protein